MKDNQKVFVTKNFEVYNSEVKQTIFIECDPDGLGLVQLREKCESDFIRITFDREMGLKIAESLKEFCETDANFET